MCASSLTGPQKYKADRRSPEAPNWLPGPMIASGCCVRDFGVFRCISEGGSKKDHKLSTPRFTMDRPEDREYSYCIHDREKLHQPASPEPDSRGQVARRRAKNRERLTLTASHYSQSLQSHTHHRHSTEWQWGGAGAVMTHESCVACAMTDVHVRSCGAPQYLPFLLYGFYAHLPAISRRLPSLLGGAGVLHCVIYLSCRCTHPALHCLQ